MDTRPSDPYTNFGGQVLAGGAADSLYVNGVLLVPAATGTGVQVKAFGDDTNINIALVPKGAGTIVNAGGAGAAGAAGGAISDTGGAGGAGSSTTAGGAGGAATLAGGAGGAKADTGTAAGGAGGNAAITAGVGGATAATTTGPGGAGGDVPITAGAGGAASAGTANGGAGGTITLTPGAGGTSAGGTAGVAGVIIERGTKLVKQGTPTAKTVSATLTAAEVLAGIITVNQAAGGTSAQQLPLASGMDTALPDAAADDAFDFSVINTSTVDAEDASVTTNTGWTLVGSMDIHAYSAAGSLNSSARFRARKTGAATWTLYRIS